MISNCDTLREHERVCGLPEGIKIKSFWPRAEQWGRKNHCDLRREKSQGTIPTDWLVHPTADRRRKRGRVRLLTEGNRGRGREREGCRTSSRGRETKRHKTCDFTKEGRYQRQVRHCICCFQGAIFDEIWSVTEGCKHMFVCESQRRRRVCVCLWTGGGGSWHRHSWAMLVCFYRNAVPHKVVLCPPRSCCRLQLWCFSLDLQPFPWVSEESCCCCCGWKLKYEEDKDFFIKEKCCSRWLSLYFC